MSKKQVIFGLHAVKILLQERPQEIYNLCLQHKNEDLELLAKQQNIPIEYWQKAKLDKLTQSAVHQGIVAMVREHALKDERDLEEYIEQLLTTNTELFILILDGIQDPHNLGACLRSAQAAGVNAVVIPKNRASSITGVVHKASSGAASVLPIFQVTNLARTQEYLRKQGVWLYGAAVEARDLLYDLKFSGHVAIVMGAEGAGMRNLTQKNRDYLFKIPMPGNIESLNVSVATGICLFEVVRQRLQ